MEATLYFNKSDNRYVLKDIEEIRTFNVEILDDSSITDPVLKLSLPTGYMNANYLWLKDLHRYYYINNITLSKGYAILTCHVDVLMTYAAEIRNESCIVRRNEALDRCNSYQVDDEKKLNSYPCTRTLKFPEDMGFDSTVNEFVMGVVGDV